MKKNNSWFSIIFAIWFVVIITLITSVLLTFLFPFSKNIKGVENSSFAYYQALSWIEKALYEKKSLDLWEDKSWVFENNKIKYSYNIEASWSILPPAWKWDSEYDKDWNKFSLNEPIQLKLKNKDIDWSKVKFSFRVPDFSWNWNKYLEEISWDKKMILWQYSGYWFILDSSTWAIITTDDINWWNEISLGSKTWILHWAWIDRTKVINQNNPITLSFENFDNWNKNSISNYWSPKPNLIACKNTTCTLKMSLINKLIIKENWKEQEIPYLEYKIDFSQAWVKVPTRLVRIKSNWKVFGFSKNIKIKLPQDSSIWAFDFTIFQ